MRHGDYKLSTVPTQDVLAVWPRIADMVESGLDESAGEFAPEDVQKALLLREMQLWVMHKEGDIQAIGLTRIVQFPQFNVGEIAMVSGHGARKMLPFVDSVFKPWARENGCAELRIFGRVGWMKLLPDWKDYGITLRTLL